MVNPFAWLIPIDSKSIGDWNTGMQKSRRFFAGIPAHVTDLMGKEENFVTDTACIKFYCQYMKNFTSLTFFSKMPILSAKYIYIFVNVHTLCIL